MSPDPVDAWLEAQLGAPVLSRTPVGGGCSHRAWRVACADGAFAFLKTNAAAALPRLQAEADGLAALASFAPGSLRLPLVLGSGVVASQALLLLSWLELDAAASAGRWQQLGRALAQLHQNSIGAGPGAGRFGWQHDNFIGSSPQRNGYRADWAAFFLEQRLQPQLRQAAASGLAFRGVDALLERVADRLGSHRPAPVLVHGDLWSGNAGLLRDPAVCGAIYDPAVYRGDREVDLAMARLFGGFPPAFFSGYEQEWPLPAGAAARWPIYDLYHLLNHANLFGGGYRQQVQHCIDGLLKP